MNTYKDAQGNYYDREYGTVIRAGVNAQGEIVTNPDSKWVVLKTMHTDFDKEPRIALPEDIANQVLTKTGPEDMGTVHFYSGKCPECSEALAIGRCADKAKVVARVRESLECRYCGTGFADAEAEQGPYEDDDFVSETKFEVIKPYVARHMKDAQ